jgi:hypothetical protein
MKYCSKCGIELQKGESFCPKCGTETMPGSQQRSNSYKNPAIQDAPSTGFAVLGFFLPIVGLVLYLVWKDQTPLKANSAGKGALYSVIFVVSLYVLTFCSIIAASL